MSCLEHVLENGLMSIEKMNKHKWMEKMKNDVNLPYTNISLDDLWTICQYVVYGCNNWHID